MLPLVAYLVPEWRPQTVICGASILPLVVIMPFFPESPRWLLAKARPPLSLTRPMHTQASCFAHHQRRPAHSRVAAACGLWSPELYSICQERCCEAAVPSLS